MYYFTYETTNKINGKVYGGAHITKDLADGYLGSGTLLKRAIRKYDEKNFDRRILKFFQSPEEMFAAEAELVNEAYVARKDTYNIKKGGMGGWDYVNATMSPKIRRKSTRAAGKISGHIHKIRWQIDPVYRSKSLKALQSNPEKQKSNDGWKRSFLGKHHTKETKLKMAQKISEKARGENNSQYGTQWITNGKENRKIKLWYIIPLGWQKGRVI